MVIALTGAGISKSAGIPTFAEQPGLRDRLTREYANEHPGEYQKTIKKMQDACAAAEPTKAHMALRDANVPVITMNVDGLHQKAESQTVLPIHGTLPDIVLYDDPAPLYQTAEEWVGKMQEGDTLLIIGTSFYTNIAVRLRNLAYRMGADAILINEDADTNVPGVLELLTGGRTITPEKVKRFFERGSS